MKQKHPGGRPRGSRNKVTILREIGMKATLATSAASGMTPLQIMLHAMRLAAEAEDWPLAAALAEKAAPYVHAKLAPMPVDPPADDADAKARDLLQRLREMEATIGGAAEKKPPTIQ